VLARLLLSWGAGVYCRVPSNNFGAERTEAFGSGKAPLMLALSAKPISAIWNELLVSPLP